MTGGCARLSKFQSVKVWDERGGVAPTGFVDDTKLYVDKNKLVFRLPQTMKGEGEWWKWHPQTQIIICTYNASFLIAGILYDVGMLAYCIYMEDIFTVLLVVRLIMGLYQLSDQLWLVKHWVPFFVQKEKRRFFFVRMYLIGSIWFLVVGSTSWTGSWQERNDIFANVYYIIVFVIIVGCGLWYLIQGGVDFLVKYRFHWTRNIMVFCALSGMILGIVGLIIGDGGGNSLAETSKYHSAFVMIYFVFECTIVVIIQRFMVVFEELSWKYPNPITPPSTLSCKESTTFEATNGILSGSNKIMCDMDVPLSSIEDARTGCIPEDTGAIVMSPFNHNNVDVRDVEPSREVRRFAGQDGKEEEDLEATYGLATRSAAVSVGDAPSATMATVTTPVPTRSGSIIVSYQKAQRRLALAFDGINRRSSILRTSILTQQIMMVRLKRHVLVCREIDKLYSVLYQLLLWEVVIWLAQIFLALYLQSVNTPTLPGENGYYCQSPLENTANSAQFANDFVFARR